MTKPKIIFIVLTVFCLSSPARQCKAQSFKINLSPKHDQKLSAIKSGHKRIVKYHKYVSRDSAKDAKQSKKLSNRESDSLRKADRKQKRALRQLTKQGLGEQDQIAVVDSLQKEYKLCQVILKDSTASKEDKKAAKVRLRKINRDRASAMLAKGGHPAKFKNKEMDSLRNELQQWWVILKDSTSNDSTKNVAKGKVKELSIAVAMHNPQFKGMYEQYQLYGQAPNWKMLNKFVPGMDTLNTVLDATPQELMEKAEGFAMQQAINRAGQSDFGEKTGQISEMKGMLNEFSNPESMKEEGKEKGKEQALDHFAQHAEKLQAAQGNLGGLLGKYREFTDSNDLSNAVKRSSLKGKTFMEHIVIGGNFAVQSTDPIAVDMSPIIGYKFNKKLYAGLGMNYRHTFSDSLKGSWYVSPSNTSFRLFVNYTFFRNYFAYTEVERAGLKLKENSETKSNIWRTNYFIGGGRKILIHPKLHLTVTALYNLNNERNNPAYPRRFQVRIGFQTSELAFRKKKIYYDH